MISNKQQIDPDKVLERLNKAIQNFEEYAKERRIQQDKELEQLESWVKQIAKETGVKLEY